MKSIVEALRDPFVDIVKFVVLMALLAALAADLYGLLAYGLDRYDQPHCYPSNRGTVCCYAPGCPGVDD